MAIKDFGTGTAPAFRGMGLLVGVLLGGLAMISLGYSFFYGTFVCGEVMAEWKCRTLALGVPRVLCAAALMALLVVQRPALRQLVAGAQRPHGAPIWR
ncbi:hypothetical protein [Mangrovicoccus ximenensis]|uniref:hypothetical protein n=1 Tax=Mangrovicoccus ximenensis TaxID=1911570 RepID=UPI000D376462|nr:hypothetical protein [Mangrovicoccus ximenensis]